MFTLFSIPKAFEGHISVIQRNELGTPSLGDVFVEAERPSRDRLLVYVNSDISPTLRALYGVWRRIRGFGMSPGVAP